MEPPTSVTSQTYPRVTPRDAFAAALSQSVVPGEDGDLEPLAAGATGRSSSAGSSINISGLSAATQILIKNTFIQFDEPAAIGTADASRPRGESCDAVLLTPTGHVAGPASGSAASGSSRTKPQAHDSLLCGIPENASPRETEEARGPRDVTPPSPGSQPPYTRGASSDEELEFPRNSVSPAELLESLSSCEQVKRMPLEDLPTPSHNRTTIMLRNIPNKYTQQMLLDTVNQEFQGLYDFFYLPIDFKNKCNVGYAFINFIHPYYADLFSRKFAGVKLTAFKSKKICEVSWGRVQGLRANIEHYRNSAIMSIPNSQYKPLVFKDGIPLRFPGAAGPVPAVRPRHGRGGGGGHPGSHHIPGSSSHGGASSGGSTATPGLAGET